MSVNNSCTVNLQYEIFNNEIIINNITSYIHSEIIIIGATIIIWNGQYMVITTIAFLSVYHKHIINPIIIIIVYNLCKKLVCTNNTCAEKIYHDVSNFLIIKT